MACWSNLRLASLSRAKALGIGRASVYRILEAGH